MNQNSKHELFMCFRAGWKDGARAKTEDPTFTNHTKSEFQLAYLRGYGAARKAASAAFKAECEFLDYDPTTSILRGSPLDNE